MLVPLSFDQVPWGTAGWAMAQPKSVTIAPEQAADYVHQVLEGDRTAYARHLVEHSRLSPQPPHRTLEPGQRTQPRTQQRTLDLTTMQDWERQDGIPVPTQLFRLGYDFAAEEGKISYGLISPWAFSKGHQPREDFEKTAMAAVLQTGEPYGAYREFRGISYFSVLYPDRAIAPSCVDCHNHHPQHRARYPEQIFELGDIMGGMLINIPLD